MEAALTALQRKANFAAEQRREFNMPNPAHESTSVEDAMTMLDSRIPLTHAERKLIVTSLYDLAFREGARQGRQAGIEHVENHLRIVASQTPSPEVRDAVLGVANSYGDGPAGEYAEPTQVIREKLAEKARVRNGLA